MEAVERLRRDVAQANRILERMGLSNAFGHASARIPGTNTFLLSTRRSPGLADADNDVPGAAPELDPRHIHGDFGGAGVRQPQVLLVNQCGIRRRMPFESKNEEH